VITFKYYTRRGVLKQGRLYHKFDLPWDYEAVKWHECTNEDSGKFIMFDDGSELFTRVLKCNAITVTTECGLYRRDDLIHCFDMKNPYANYSGVPAGAEHTLVRPLTRQEKGLVTRYQRGDKLKYVTPRIVLSARDVMKKKLEDLGVTGSTIVENYYRLSQGKGPQALTATDRMAMIMGVNTTKLEEDEDLGKLKARKQLDIDLIKGLSGGNNDVDTMNRIKSNLNDVASEEIYTHEVRSDIEDGSGSEDFTPTEGLI